MKKLRKLYLILSIVIVVSIVLAGCGSNNKSGQDKTNDSTQNNTEIKELNLRVSVPNFGVDPEGTLIQNEWHKKMEAYMGMKLNIQWERLPWNDYREKESVVLASGNLPDVFSYSNFNSILQYGAQGVLLELSPYLDLAPNYMKFVKSTPDYQNAVFTEDGKTYAFLDGFVNYNDIEGAQSLSTAAYRFDIFKKHNIKIPETIDEFYAAAKKLKELYPDVYPINISSSGFSLQRALANVYHTNTDGIYWNGSEFVLSYVEESYKEMLQFLNKLYSEKLIDPEFLTDNDDRATEKALNGKVFMLPSVWAGMANHYNRNGNGIEWGLAMLPENPKYGKPWIYLAQQPGRTLQQRFGIAISAKTKYPELVVKLIDHQYSDEMIQLMNWGIEGETYRINEKGEKEFLPEIMSAPDPVRALAEKGVSSSMSCRSGIVFTPQDFEANIAQLSPEPWYHKGEFMMHQYWKATAEFGGKEAIAPFDRAPKTTFNKDELNQISTVMTPVKSYANECATKFIIGEMSFSQWDEYLKTLESMGDYKSILKLYNDKVKK